MLIQVPNIDNIAAWLSTGDTAALTYTFSDSFRPVPLKRVVLGYGTNTWAANKTYDENLYKVIKKYSDKKPVLIFCGTRNACQASAEAIRAACLSEGKLWQMKQ